MGVSPLTRITSAPQSRVSFFQCGHLFGIAIEVDEPLADRLEQQRSNAVADDLPKTEAIVAMSAKRQASFGWASDIGASMTSGGIGKTELSANAIAASA